MPSSFTTNLRLTLPATGENNGTWGTLVNNGITSLVDSSIAGTATVVMSDADYTLINLNGAADEARCMFINITGTLSTTRNVICPSASKLYFVHNGTTGGQSIVFTTSGGPGVTIPNGSRAALYCNGTSVTVAFNYLGGTYAIEANSATAALRVTQTGTGDAFVVQDSANPDSTPFVVNSAGNVGVGISSPTQKLVVVDGALGGDVAIRLVNTSNTAGSGTVLSLDPGNNGFGVRDAQIRATNQSGTNDVGLSFSTANGSTPVEAMRITPAGNVGVGTTAPSQKFQVGNGSATGEFYARISSNAADLYFGQSGGNVFGLASNTIGLMLQATNFPLGFGTTFSQPVVLGTANTERVRITSTGRVGIGTATPGATLETTGSSTVDGQADVTVKIGTGGTSDLFLGSVSGNTPFVGAQGANPLTFCTAAIERMRIDASGNVGVGGSNPTQRLQVFGNLRVGSNTTATQYSSLTVIGSSGIQSSAPLLNFVSEDGTDRFAYLAHAGLGGNLYLLNQETGALQFGTGNAERMRITPSGNVGIGTDAPATTLHAIGSLYASNVAQTQGTLLVGNEGAIELFRSDSSAYIDFKTSPAEDFDCRIQQQANGLAFFTGGNGSQVERLRIDASGNVGIGTTSPSATLQTTGSTTVSGQANVAARIGAGVDSDILLGSINGNTPFVASQGAFPLAFFSNSQERMRIDASGNVGIGTTSPSVALAVANTSGQVSVFSNTTGSERLHFYTRNTAGTSRIESQNSDLQLFAFDSTNLTLGTANTERVRVTTGGNVGIGTTSPGGKAEIRSDASGSVATALVLSNPAINSVGTGADLRFYVNDGASARYAAVRSVQATSGNFADLRFLTANSDTPAVRMTITPAGNVGIGTATPSQALDVSGNIVASGTISGSDLTSGTWTPTVSNTTNVTSSTAGTMYYSRVGGVITFGGPITIQATATGAVSFQLSLPVASNFTGSGQVSGTIVASNGGDMLGVIKANATNDTMEIEYTATTTASRVFNMHGIYRIV